MTKLDFIDYIGSFKKKPGEFTKEEIVKIGIAHKKLPLNERSWDFVASAVGWTGTKDSLRMYVNSKVINKIVDDKPIEEFKGETTKEDQYVTDLQRLYIERTKVRDERLSLNRTLRDESRIENFKNDIKETVKVLNDLAPIDIKPFKVDRDSSIEAILMLSDLHLGAECDNFYNKYNKEIAKNRLSKLADDVIRYCRLHKVFKLNVVNLGDLIHGMIHITLRLDSEMDTVTQVMVAGEYVAQFLNKIRNAAPRIVYRSCSDNHSRVMANKNEQIEKDNLGKIIDWFLKERLSHTEIEFADDNIDYSLGKFTLINGKKVMFAHGHNDTIDRSFQSFVGATREFIDYGLLAHYHSSKMKEFQGFKVFVNGSIVGTEQYALSKRLFSNPSQTLIVFDNDNVVDYNIDLSINK